MHFFSGHAFLLPDDQKPAMDSLWEIALEALAEDKQILEATQRNMDRHPRAVAVPIKFDAGLVSARRLLTNRLQREAAEAAAAARPKSAAIAHLPIN